MIILHGASASPFVRKVLVALALKELPFEQIQQIPFTKDPVYRNINPLEKIPTLQDGELTICDSTVICEYLEDAYPRPALYPDNAVDKARARWYEELGGTRVAELAAGIFFQRFMRPMVLKQVLTKHWLKKLSKSSCHRFLIISRLKCLQKASFLAIL